MGLKRKKVKAERHQEKFIGDSDSELKIHEYVKPDSQNAGLKE